MTDNDLIRAIFDRINAEPERGRAALRAQIVRAVRGEIPHGVPWQEDESMGMEAIHQRAVAGHELIARRRDAEARARAEKFEALRKCIAADLEPDLLPHIGQLRERPETPWGYVLRIEMEGYAPIVCEYLYAAGGWKRARISLHGGMWGVIPRPAAARDCWIQAQTLDEALAVAQDHYPAHLVLAAEKPRRGWLRRLCDAIVLRRGVGAFNEFE